MAATVDVLVMPGGHRLPVPDGDTAESVYWRHCWLSLTEGICPHHQTPLRPMPTHDKADIGAHCGACGMFWRYITRKQVVAWDLDHDPHTFQSVTPDWVA